MAPHVTFDLQDVGVHVAGVAREDLKGRDRHRKWTEDSRCPQINDNGT